MYEKAGKQMTMDIFEGCDLLSKLVDDNMMLPLYCNEGKLTSGDIVGLVIYVLLSFSLLAGVTLFIRHRKKKGKSVH